MPRRRAAGRARPSERSGGSGPRPRAAEPDRLLLASATLRVPDATWLGPFSRRHPGAEIAILGYSEIGPRTVVADLWIGGRPAGVWAREIAASPDVRAAESLAEVGDGSLYRVRFRTPPIVFLYRRLEVPLPAPIHLRAGRVRWEIVARDREFGQILRFARRVDPGVRVKWTRTPVLRDHLPLLSPGQRSLLAAAIAAGYFAVPRRIRLTELARQTNRSKAAVSEALARIERKLLESAVRRPILGSNLASLRPAASAEPLPPRAVPGRPAPPVRSSARGPGAGRRPSSAGRPRGRTPPPR